MSKLKHLGLASATVPYLLRQSVVSICAFAADRVARDAERAKAKAQRGNESMMDVSSLNAPSPFQSPSPSPAGPIHSLSHFASMGLEADGVFGTPKHRQVQAPGSGSGSGSGSGHGQGHSLSGSKDGECMEAEAVMCGCALLDLCQRLLTGSFMSESGSLSVSDTLEDIVSLIRSPAIGSPILIDKALHVLQTLIDTHVGVRPCPFASLLSLTLDGLDACLDRLRVLESSGLSSEIGESVSVSAASAHGERDGTEIANAHAKGEGKVKGKGPFHVVSPDFSLINIFPEKGAEDVHTRTLSINSRRCFQRYR
jgi:hypothetical protein